MITRRLRERQDEKNAELATLRAELALAGERTRLSREIHDGVGNALAAAVLRLEVAARMSEKQRPETGPVTLLREEAQALREAMNAVRDWTFFTRPWPTAPSGGSPSSGSSSETFGQILEREAARLGQRTGLPVFVEGADALNDLPEPARVAALRITQEALTNAAKYARAEHASVSVRRDGSGICLTVRDDGQGFDPTGTAPTRPGIGLTGMRERAESLGGTLEVSAAPGAGVTVCARLPVS
jgi:signal transduction histidine kinase